MNYNFYSYLLYLTIGLSISNLEAYKIIIQVSPPRCLSTASLRAWQSRGDCEVMNEPFIPAFIMQNENAKKITHDWWRADASVIFADIERNILQISHERMVFVKEISFSLLACLQRDSSLLRNPDVYFIFLIRNPHHTVYSFYKKQDNGISDDFSYYIGFEACYGIFQMVRRLGVNKPIIMTAEDLYNQPRETMAWFCKELEIPFRETMLQWQNLGDAFTGSQEWRELKKTERTHHWHGDAIKSTGFHIPNVCEVDSQGNPTFAEIADEKDRVSCMEAYYRNKIFYDLLLQEKNNS